jgi:flagellar hook-associated protein 2
MGDQLRAFDTRIAEMNRKLTMKETQYYKQFTAMETAMNKYNSTSSSLSSM